MQSRLPCTDGAVKLSLYTYYLHIVATERRRGGKSLTVTSRYREIRAAPRAQTRSRRGAADGSAHAAPRDNVERPAGAHRFATSLIHLFPPRGLPDPGDAARVANPPVALVALRARHLTGPCAVRHAFLGPPRVRRGVQGLARGIAHDLRRRIQQGRWMRGGGVFCIRAPRCQRGRHDRRAGSQGAAGRDGRDGRRDVRQI